MFVTDDQILHVLLTTSLYVIEIPPEVAHAGIGIMVWPLKWYLKEFPHKYLHIFEGSHK